MRSFPERSARAGFTLIEMMVALMLGGILTTVLLQLMQGNSRFVAMQSAREEVQQNGRASLDLISGDLRGLPASAIRDFQPNSLRFYLPRAWGILCTPLTAGSTVAYVIFPAGTFPADFRPNEPHWGVAVEHTTNPANSTGTYEYVSTAQAVAETNECNAVQPNADDAALYYTTGLSVPMSLVNGAQLFGGTSILPGTQVMVFEEMQYNVAASSGGPPGNWIQRMSGYNGTTPNMQPMAGPVPRDTSLVFRYLTDDGADAALAANIRKIRVWIEVQSRSRRSQGGVLRPEQVDTMTTDIILRNR